MKHPDAKTKIQVPEAFKPLIENLRELTKDGHNPNKMRKSRREALWRSLKKFGWFKPLLVDGEGLLGDGEQRLEACLANDEFYAPVLRLDVDDKDRRLLRQVANKLRGTHDPELDAAEYRRIVDAGGQQDLVRILQLREKELREALENINPKLDDYEIPPLEMVETSIVEGDIFQLGDHRLMCGDSTIKLSVDKLIGDIKINCLFTDPPYGVYGEWENSLRDRKKTGGASTYIDIEPAQYEEFSFKWLLATRPHLANYNALYIWINGANLKRLLNAAEALDYKLDIFIQWVKNTSVHSRLDYRPKHQTAVYGWYKKHKWYGPRNEVNIWNYPKPSKSKEHPTMMPIEICVRGITNSTMPEHNILDLFGGSGSTLIACEQINRNCYMMEIDPRYCQIIIDRFKAYTGKTAEKL